MKKKPAAKAALMKALAAKMKAINEGTDKPRAGSPPAIDAALMKAINASGRTHYALGKATGVAPSILDRFMMPADDPRHRDLRLATAARIAAALNLELVPR